MQLFFSKLFSKEKQKIHPKPHPSITDEWGFFVYPYKTII